MSPPHELGIMCLCHLVRTKGSTLRRTPASLLGSGEVPEVPAAPPPPRNHPPVLSSSVAPHVSLLPFSVARGAHPLLGFGVTCSFLAGSACSFFHANKPLRASKSRLNNQSMFPCWRMPGQAGLGAKWLSPVQRSRGSRRALVVQLLSDSRRFGSPGESPEITPLIPTPASGSPFLPHTTGL